MPIHCREARALRSVAFAGPDTKTEGRNAMNKRQLIDDIRQINTTAQPAFLAQFNENALKQYLDHLESARRKRSMNDMPKVMTMKLVS